jgi:hypothetical protein
MAHGAVSSWQRIPRAKRRVRLASRVQASCTNSSSPPSREPRIHRLRCGRTVLASRSITRLRELMKTASKTPTAGAATRPGDRKPGKSSANGSGISDSNWGTSWSRCLCAPPSLLRLSHREARRQPLVRPPPLLRLGMVHLPPLPPGKQAAFPARTLLASSMGRFGARLTRS